MAQLFDVHPVDPQVRSLRQAAQILDHGGVGAIPTDSCYALGLPSRTTRRRSIASGRSAASTSATC